MKHVTNILILALLSVLLPSCQSPALYRPMTSSADRSLPRAPWCRQHVDCVVSPYTHNHISIFHIPPGSVVQDPVTLREFALVLPNTPAPYSSSSTQSGNGSNSDGGMRMAAGLLLGAAILPHLFGNNNSDAVEDAPECRICGRPATHLGQYCNEHSAAISEAQKRGEF